ncbi:MAG: hypothetical protein J0H78_08910 [Rhizobiales bacterium]|nr:hypothetical protein [Hyphomicrobiales bacterium]
MRREKQRQITFIVEIEGFRRARIEQEEVEQQARDQGAPNLRARRHHKIDRAAKRHSRNDMAPRICSQAGLSSRTDAGAYPAI